MINNMFKNYIKTAWRNLIRDKAYVLINIIGLSVGIAASLIIGLYIFNELSYDKFHKDSERIYRIYVDGSFGATKFYSPLSSNEVKGALLSEFGEVEAATRFFKRDEQLIRVGEKKYTENDILFADADFFDVFSFQLIKGDEKNALSGPGKIVLTESTAKKYFGEEDPMGKILRMRGENSYKVTGVCRDVPRNSHFHFNLITSYASSQQSKDHRWVNMNIYTYMRLNDADQKENLESKFQLLMDKYLGPEVSELMGVNLEQFSAQGNRFEFKLQALESIYLHSDFNDEIEPVGDISRIWYFSIIALFILFIACINFMNLATAKYANRAKEVGIRKVVGSGKRQLVAQFLWESVMLSGISLIIGVALLELFLPMFNQLAQKKLIFNYLDVWYVVPGLIAFAFFIGLLAGIYPAFYLSSFNPQRTLKGKIYAGTGSIRLRGILVVVQFVITISLFVSTAIIFQQNRFMLDKKLGFDKEKILVLDKAWLLRNSKDVFVEELKKIPGVKSAAITHKVPGQEYNGSTMQIGDRTAEDVLFFAVNYAGEDYFKTMGMEIVDGRGFSEEYSTDKYAIIINETAAKNANLEDPVGSYLVFGNERFDIIGVVKDFHFETLHKPIRSLVIRHHRDRNYRFIAMRVEMDGIQSTIKSIDNTWSEFKAEEPIDYFFLDNNFNSLYQEEQRTAKVFITFSILAIFIACLGLFGLSAFMAEKRKKEIGIRKAMGARVRRILALLYREIFVLLILSTLISWPLSYYLMKLWLQKFAFRIEMSFVPFIAASLIALIIAILTTGFQAAKAANTNPAYTLRDE